MNRRYVSRGNFRREGSPGPRTLRANEEVDRDRETARNRPASGGLEWKKMDLHLHTPASSDYRDPGISYLDILKKAEDKGLDLIAFADHNTVAGYAAMHREIETLTLLERLGRMTDTERSTLNEYRRLLAKINVLPGFEFTATFGFHILGIFPEGTSVRKLEYLLLNLNVPEEKMLAGAADVGSTSDVLSAYQAITQAGGLAIAAHANSSNGVAMQGFPFGGQTKIAYTQDPNLAAMEVTDLEVTGRRTTANFYNASKPEYPRRMHLIQGSDAHALNTEQIEGNKRLGVGARITEILVKEASFAALKELLLGNDFTRTRPYRQGSGWESVEAARREGPTLTTAFHERAISRTSRTRPILQDIVAMANAEGGTIYVGASPETAVPVTGVERPDEAIRILKEDISRTIEPPVEPEFAVKGGQERGVVIITVPRGSEMPYAFTPTGQIFIRDGGESVVANRDELVALVLEAAKQGMARLSSQPPTIPSRPGQPIVPVATGEPLSSAAVAGPQLQTPIKTQKQPQPQKQQETRRTDRREERRPEREQAPAASATPVVPAAPVPTPATAPAQPAPTPQPVQAQAEAREPRGARTPQLPPERAHLLANLPPERLKGQVRPMLPGGTFQPQTPPAVPAPETPAAPLQMAAVIPAEAVEAVEPTELPAAPNEGLELVPAGEEARSSRSRRDRRRGRDHRGEAVAAGAAIPAAPHEPQPIPVELAAEEPALDIESAPEQVAAQAEAAPAEAAPEKKPARGRGRSRKAAAAEVEAPTLGELETPMETTVSAEHTTREELVLAEAEQTGDRSGIEMQIEAPTAAAAETEAGAEAILVEAEVQPGAQIPGELSATEVAPDLTSPPAKKGRARRKTAAEKAAEAAAEAAEAAEKAAQADAPAPEPEHLPEPEPAPVEADEKATASKGRKRDRKKRGAEQVAQTEAEPEPGTEPEAAGAAPVPNLPTGTPPDAPRTGVEIIATEERNNGRFHTMRDLRNSTTVHNVTRQSARRLWHYAIVQHEHGDPTYAEVAWHPQLPIGIWRREHRAGEMRYDLISRYPDGSMRIFYGVSSDGLHGPWVELVRMASDADYWGPPASE